MQSARARTAPLVLVALVLTGCATAPVVETSPPATLPDSTTGQRLFDIAALQLGAPYRLGGAGPAAFDCSGLVTYAHAAVGISVPRTAAQQRESARAVPLDALRAGDLLFFRMNGAAVDHVGIYNGAGEFLHAPGRGRGIERARFDAPWYRSRFVAAGRFWSEAGELASGANQSVR
jgi:cell wall-associated NlpC family hydrolase